MKLIMSLLAGMICGALLGGLISIPLLTVIVALDNTFGKDGMILIVFAFVFFCFCFVALLNSLKRKD